MKICNLCTKSLDASMFGKNKRMPDGLMPNCKTCTNERARLNYYDSDSSRNRVYLRRYGITLEAVTAMAEAQNYQCPICDKTCAFLAGNRDNAFVVDHCHETGAVRGLICATCNRGLGLFYDKPDILRRAADYLVTPS